MFQIFINTVYDISLDMNKGKSWNICTPIYRCQEQVEMLFLRSLCNCYCYDYGTHECEHGPVIDNSSWVRIFELCTHTLKETMDWLIRICDVGNTHILKMHMNEL
jgi:hypothetical protein